MASIAQAATRRPAGMRGGVSKRAEHIFFTGYMVALVALIFVGFAPSFYLRDAVTPPQPLTALRLDMIVHGTLASLFMLAFPVQGFLAATRRLKAHVTLGKWAFALGALLVPLAYFGGAAAYHAKRPIPMPPGMAEAFVILPLAAMVFLPVALWLAWRNRFDGPTHKRQMVALACFMADPAIFRLPIWEPGPDGLLFIQAVMLGTLVPLWLWDAVTLRRMHKGTLIGSGIFLAEIVVRTLVMPTAAWASLIHALPLYGTA